jgi:hypothetical protein
MHVAQCARIARMGGDGLRDLRRERGRSLGCPRGVHARILARPGAAGSGETVSILSLFFERLAPGSFLKADQRKTEQGR